MRIAIIDSGINAEHKALKGKIDIVETVSFSKNELGEIEKSNQADDELGHGTGVAWIINKYAPNAEYIIVKIFTKEFQADEDVLIEALQYLNNKCNCSVINISAGITQCENIEKMGSVCEELKSNGCIVVAAFDNDGALSYPAAFNSVIGVDVSLSCFSMDEFQYVQNSPINIRGMGRSQILPALNDEYIEQKGASFAAPIITGIICKWYLENELDYGGEVGSFLREKAKKIYTGNAYRCANQLKISKAIILPITKETKALITHADLLPFEISQVCDVKYSGNIGKHMEDIAFSFGEISEGIKNLKVDPISEIQWNSDADTVVIGHINMLNKASRAVDLKEQLLEKCLLHNKQVYMYDMVDCTEDTIEKLRNKGLSIRVPTVSKDDVCTNTFGKLYQLSTPVLGVYGTSPKQGKFTLQLRLRKALSEVGYRVANFGTEPESELFGFEATYAMGYNTTVSLSGSQAVAYVNYTMHEIEKNSPDLIIVGSQSQTIPTGTGSLGYMPIAQHEFLLGTQADGYILCVNITDDIEYIRRTIAYLTSVTEAKVIAIAIYPLVYEIEGGYYTKIIGTASEEKINRMAQLLKTEFNINSYSMNDDSFMKKLQFDIESFFS